MAKKKIKAAADPAEQISANQFELDGKKYNVLKGAVLPLSLGFQKLTAADICVEVEAQQYLVANRCSCIEEVIE